MSESLKRTVIVSYLSNIIFVSLTILSWVISPNSSNNLLKINEAGCSIKFVKIESDNFNANLQMIDSQFPLIASEYLYQRYTSTESSIKDITEKVKSANPCNFNKDLLMNN